MSGCKIVRFFSVSGAPLYEVSSPALATAQCETHDWTFGAPFAGELCPLGRIEDAVAHAITAIEAAKNAPPPRVAHNVADRADRNDHGDDR